MKFSIISFFLFFFLSPLCWCDSFFDELEQSSDETNYETIEQPFEELPEQQMNEQPLIIEIAPPHSSYLWNGKYLYFNLLRLRDSQTLIKLINLLSLYEPQKNLSLLDIISPFSKENISSLSFNTSPADRFWNTLLKPEIPQWLKTDSQTFLNSQSCKNNPVCKNLYPAIVCKFKPLLQSILDISRFSKSSKTRVLILNIQSSSETRASLDHSFKSMGISLTSFLGTYSNNKLQEYLIRLFWKQLFQPDLVRKKLKKLYSLLNSSPPATQIKVSKEKIKFISQSQLISPLEYLLFYLPQVSIKRIEQSIPKNSIYTLSGRKIILSELVSQAIAAASISDLKQVKMEDGISPLYESHLYRLATIILGEMCVYYHYGLIYHMNKQILSKIQGIIKKSMNSKSCLYFSEEQTTMFQLKPASLMLKKEKFDKNDKSQINLAVSVFMELQKLINSVFISPKLLRLNLTYKQKQEITALLSQKSSLITMLELLSIESRSKLQSFIAPLQFYSFVETTKGISILKKDNLIDTRRLKEETKILEYIHELLLEQLNQNLKIANDNKLLNNMRTYLSEHSVYTFDKQGITYTPEYPILKKRPIKARITLEKQCSKDLLVLFALRLLSYRG
jgi:hypothetical protein